MDNIDKWELLTRLYRDDKRVRDSILHFFSTRKGVRCACFQDKTIGVYWRYGWNEQKALTGLDIDNFWRRIKSAKGLVTFFYGYVFNHMATDPKYLHWEFVRDEKGRYVIDSKGNKKIKIFHDYDIIGSSIVFEIDAPEVNGRKVDFFSKRYYPEFMWVKTKVEQVLDRAGAQYNCMFSGNGIYIIVESSFFDEMKNMEMNLRKFRLTTQNMLEQIQPWPGGGHPVIDLRDIGWATYFKIPWTFHEVKNRMTIPLGRGYIDREWLLLATNMLNAEYLTSEANITDILNKARWVKDIW